MIKVKSCGISIYHGIAGNGIKIPFVVLKDRHPHIGQYLPLYYTDRCGIIERVANSDRESIVFLDRQVFRLGNGNIFPESLGIGSYSAQKKDDPGDNDTVCFLHDPGF
jgi:hypothetical protein